MAFWTEEKEKIVREMWAAGEKKTVIAATIGATDAATRWKIRRLGLPDRPYNVATEWTPEMISALITMWRAGSTLQQIGDAVGVTRKVASLKVGRIRKKQPWLVPIRARRNRELNPVVCEVQTAVAKEFKVDISQLIGASREAIIAGPRHIAMALAKRMTDESLVDLAYAFNRKDHTTIKYGVEIAERSCKDKLDELEARIREKVLPRAAE